MTYRDTPTRARRRERLFNERLAAAKTQYMCATHPSQRIEAWLVIERMEGKASPVVAERDWSLRRMPAEVINIRMMG